MLDLRGKKVLIVDDFFNFRLNVRNMLSFFRPRDIDEAANGEDAVGKISQKKYDIILCDYNLGAGKDGQQVLEEAKFNNYINYATIFMMVTAENTMEMFLGALEYEPDDYLMKPFTRDTLEKKINDLIAKKEVRKDVDEAVAAGEYEKALRLCNEWIDNNSKHLAELFRLKGEILTKLGDYGQAVSFYKEVINMGRFPWAVLALGKVTYLSENYDDALQIFSDLIKSNNKLMPAYDWLAKTLQKLNKNREAQQILINAIAISPKAIQRQKELGDLAYRNEDLVTAEKTFKTVVKQGKNSCFKSATDYTKLAKVLTERDAGEEGLLVLKDANKEFVNNPKAAVQVALTESLVYKKMNRVEDAKKATDKVMSILNSESDKTSTDFELDMAKATIRKRMCLRISRCSSRILSWRMKGRR
jgi:DNA-binding NarL/FixJ family response regulator/predicted metal-binding transcription factor (methanogenesis marker protein 9)